MSKPDIGGRLRQWATEQALPLWAEAGFDTEHGRFRELLTLKGEPIHHTPHRLIVQGRQIHTYAVAQKRGWYRAGDKIEQAYRSMLRDYQRARLYTFLSPDTDPLGPLEAAGRVFRGGSWRDRPEGCRSAERPGREPAQWFFHRGFRVARVQAGR